MAGLPSLMLHCVTRLQKHDAVNMGADVQAVARLLVFDKHCLCHNIMSCLFSVLLKLWIALRETARQPFCSVNNRFERLKW